MSLSLTHQYNNVLKVRGRLASFDVVGNGRSRKGGSGVELVQSSARMIYCANIAQYADESAAPPLREAARFSWRRFLFKCTDAGAATTSEERADARSFPCDVVVDDCSPSRSSFR